jgi:Fic family protein
MATDWPPVGWEDRTWTWHDAGGRPSNRADREFERYRSAVPAEISDRPLPLSDDTHLVLSDAQAALAVLDAEGRFDLTALAGVLLRSEAVASSKIEHLEADPRDVAIAQLGIRTGKPDAARVAGNAEAMLLAINLVNPTDPLRLDVVLTLHRVLMTSDPYEGRWAGRLRDEQSWIGGSDRTPRDAAFVPPRPELVPRLVDDLVTFANRDDIHAIAQAAVLHAQFETVHPFTDGNGRTGRTLIHTLLRRRGVLGRTVVPLSTVLLADTSAYFGGLGAYRDGDLDGWVRQFATAAHVAASEGRLLASDMEEVHARWRDQVRPRRGSGAEALLDVAIRQPVLDIDVVERHLGVARKNAYEAIERLVAADVLEEVTGLGRNRVWAADDVLELVRDLERRVGRRSSA